MSEELKPCPFCGGTNVTKQSIQATMQHGYYRWMHCDSCGASGPWVDGDKSAIDAWNKRPIEDALAARVAELEAANRWIPVGERLPEKKDEWYPAWQSSEYERLCLQEDAYFDEDGHWHTQDGYIVELWHAPLPEPPEASHA